MSVMLPFFKLGSLKGSLRFRIVEWFAFTFYNFVDILYKEKEGFDLILSVLFISEFWIGLALESTEDLMTESGEDDSNGSFTDTRFAFNQLIDVAFIIKSNNCIQN